MGKIRGSVTVFAETSYTIYTPLSDYIHSVEIWFLFSKRFICCSPFSANSLNWFIVSFILGMLPVYMYLLHPSQTWHLQKRFSKFQEICCFHWLFMNFCSCSFSILRFRLLIHLLLHLTFLSFLVQSFDYIEHLQPLQQSSSRNCNIFCAIYASNQFFIVSSYYFNSYYSLVVYNNHLLHVHYSLSQRELNFPVINFIFSGSSFLALAISIWLVIVSSINVAISISLVSFLVRSLNACFSISKVVVSFFKVVFLFPVIW